MGSQPIPRIGNLILGAVGDDGRFTIIGTISVGETYTVVHSVGVLTWAEQGNHLIGNVLADPTSAWLVGQRSSENSSSGTVAIDGTDLAWTGALPIGSSVEVLRSMRRISARIMMRPFPPPRDCLVLW